MPGPVATLKSVTLSDGNNVYEAKDFSDIASRADALLKFPDLKSSIQDLIKKSVSSAKLLVTPEGKLKVFSENKWIDLTLAGTDKITKEISTYSTNTLTALNSPESSSPAPDESVKANYNLIYSTSLRSRNISTINPQALPNVSGTDCWVNSLSQMINLNPYLKEKFQATLGDNSAILKYDQSQSTEKRGEVNRRSPESFSFESGQQDAVEAMKFLLTDSPDLTQEYTESYITEGNHVDPKRSTSHDIFRLGIDETISDLSLDDMLDSYFNEQLNDSNPINIERNGEICQAKSVERRFKTSPNHLFISPNRFAFPSQPDRNQAVLELVHDLKKLLNLTEEQKERIAGFAFDISTRINNASLIELAQYIETLNHIDDSAKGDLIAKTIQLLVNDEERRAYKIDRDIAVPLELDVTKHTKDNTTSKLELQSFIVHIAKESVDSGHYVNYSKVNGQWYLLDDGKSPKRCTAEEVTKASSKAYLLYYQKKESMEVSS